MELVAIVIGVGVLLSFISGYVVVATLLRGYVLSVLWRWFMVPTLGLPELSIPQAIGIALVVGMLTHQYHRSSKSKDESTAQKVVDFLEPFLSPLIALLFGWIVRLYM